jgi:hypothetical protein
VNKNQFNTIINILKVNEIIEIKEISDWSKKLQDKLLKYSVPHKDKETDNEYINIGLYSTEAQEIIYQFLIYNSNDVPDKDYYEVLLELREQYLTAKNTNV